MPYLLNTGPKLSYQFGGEQTGVSAPIEWSRINSMGDLCPIFVTPGPKALLHNIELRAEYYPTIPDIATAVITHELKPSSVNAQSPLMKLYSAEYEFLNADIHDSLYTHCLPLNLPTDMVGLQKFWLNAEPQWVVRQCQRMFDSGPTGYPSHFMKTPFASHLWDKLSHVVDKTKISELIYIPSILRTAIEWMR